jgi:hypothetical protein
MKFSPMQLLDQLLLAGPTWIGVSLTAAAIMLGHVLRRCLPQAQRSRGEIMLMWFYLALSLRFSGNCSAFWRLYGVGPAQFS